jgi:hypothetical protein
MKRRLYLSSAVTCAITAVAGCTDQTANQGKSTTTRAEQSQKTTEKTQTATETATAAPASFEVQSVSFPDSVPIGDSFHPEITVANSGGQEGTWRAKLYNAITYGTEPEDWSPISIDLFIPEGETRIWTESFETHEFPTVEYYRLEDGEVHEVHSPGEKTPIISLVNLITEWQNFGDVEENSIQSADPGEYISIGFRYWYYQQNRSIEVTEQVRIYNTDTGNRVAIDSFTDSQVTTRNGWQQWEYAIDFDTSGWDSGRYEAEVLVRDDISGEVSEAATTTFELQ